MALMLKLVLASSFLLLFPHFTLAQDGQECEVAGECVGVLLSVMDATNAGECVYTCKQVTGCTWYMHYTPFIIFLW